MSTPASTLDQESTSTAPQEDTAATVYFGFDCAVSALDVLGAAQAAYGPVDFVGRYTEGLPGYSTALTRSEIAGIFAQKKAILPIYNGALPGDVMSTYQDGCNNAAVAARHLRALGAPDGTAIAIDIEAGWLPSVAFLRGWIVTTHAAGYTPVVYCNVMEYTHAGPLVQAIAQTGVVCHLWSSEPEATAWWGTRRTAWWDFSRDLSGNPAPLGAANAHLVTAHQYGEGEVNGRADLDVIHAALWPCLFHQTPPTPPPTPGTRETIAACGLKPQPHAGGPDRARLPAGGRFHDTGVRRNGYAYIQWRDLWGFILANNVRDIPATDVAATAPHGEEPPTGEQIPVDAPGETTSLTGTWSGTWYSPP